MGNVTQSCSNMVASLSRGWPLCVFRGLINSVIPGMSLIMTCVLEAIIILTVHITYANILINKCI